MECRATSRREPIGRGNRIAILVLVWAFSALALQLLARAIGVPGIATLFPLLGTLKFTDWLLSDRPAPPARTWVGMFVAFFLAAPVAATLVWELLE